MGEGIGKARTGKGKGKGTEQKKERERDKEQKKAKEKERKRGGARRRTQFSLRSCSINYRNFRRRLARELTSVMCTQWFLRAGTHVKKPYVKDLR